MLCVEDARVVGGGFIVGDGCFGGDVFAICCRRPCPAGVIVFAGGYGCIWMHNTVGSGARVDLRYVHSRHVRLSVVAQGFQWSRKSPRDCVGLRPRSWSGYVFRPEDLLRLNFFFVLNFSLLYMLYVASQLTVCIFEGLGPISFH